MRNWVKCAAIAASAAASVSCSAETPPPQTSASAPQSDAPSADLQARFVKARDAYQAKDYATATPLLVQLCDEDKYVQACPTAGQLVANGQGVERDLEQAVILFDIGCAGGLSDPCRYAAAVYEQSAPPMRSMEIAAKFEDLACDLGDLVACTKLGDLHMTGVGVERDADKAFAYATRGCEGGVAAACTDLGWLHEPFNTHPTKGPRADRAKAFDYYTSACDMKDGRACSLLADKYEFGKEVAKDADKALELYRLAISYNPEQWVINSAQGRIKVLEKAKADAAAKQ